MDTINSGDMYLNYLASDKPHCDTETINVLPEGSLEPIETMCADINDGNMAWTIDGYSVLMNPEPPKDTVKSSELLSTLSTNNVLICNDPLFLQLSLGLSSGIQSSANDSVPTNNDPIINGSGVILPNQNNMKNWPVKNTQSLLKNCRNILTPSVLETLNIADMMDEVTAFNCRKCGLLCRTRQEMIDH